MKIIKSKKEMNVLTFSATFQTVLIQNTWFLKTTGSTKADFIADFMLTMMVSCVCMNQSVVVIKMIDLLLKNPNKRLKNNQLIKLSFRSISSPKFLLITLVSQRPDCILSKKTKLKDSLLGSNSKNTQKVSFFVLPLPLQSVNLHHGNCKNLQFLQALGCGLPIFTKKENFLTLFFSFFDLSKDFLPSRRELPNLLTLILSKLTAVSLALGLPRNLRKSRLL